MKRFSLLLIILFPVLVSGQDKLLTVGEAVATALQNNYDIMLSKNDSAVSALDYSFRSGAYLPKLTGNFGILWYDNSQRQEFNTGVVKKGSV
ncbi:MAG TPA: TolC family protein, partial [Chitinophagaceae bacterium]